MDNNYQRYYVFKETYEQLEFDVPIINDFNYDPETLRRSIIGYYKRKDGTEVEFSAQVEDPTYQSLKKRMDA